MSETRTRLFDDIKTAMKAGDKPRLATLRLVSAAVKQREVDERVELDEDAMVSVLEKMLKQRKESVAQYDKAGRDDLKAVEEAEMEIIHEYMPEAMDPAQVDAIIRAAIDESGAESVKDMGKVMGKVKPQLQGKADMGEVSKNIKALLGTA